MKLPFLNRGKSEVVTLASGKKSYPSRVRIVDSEMDERINEIEVILSKVDGFVEGILRKIVMDIVTDWNIEGDRNPLELLTNLGIVDKLEFYLPIIVRDAIYFGNAYLQFIRKDKRIIDFRYLDARYVTPEKESGVLLLDKEGKIPGYRYKPPNWFNIARSLKLKSEERRKGLFIDGDDIAHIRMFSLAGDVVGEGLIWKIRRLIQIKGNIEEALGELAHKRFDALWVCKLGDESHPVNQRILDEFKEKAVQTRAEGHDVIAIPHFYDIEIIKSDKAEDLVKALEQVSRLIMLALNYPFGIERTARLHATLPEFDYWDRVIAFYRKWFGYQIRTELLIPIVRSWGISGDIRLVWRTLSDSKDLSRARRLALYARAGLITPDTNLENKIRKLEGLPGVSSSDSQVSGNEG